MKKKHNLYDNFRIIPSSFSSEYKNKELFLIYLLDNFKSNHEFNQEELDLLYNNFSLTERIKMFQLSYNSCDVERKIILNLLRDMPYKDLDQFLINKKISDNEDEYFFYDIVRLNSDSISQKNFDEIYLKYSNKNYQDISNLSYLLLPSINNASRTIELLNERTNLKGNVMFYKIKIIENFISFYSDKNLLKQIFEYVLDETLGKEKYYFAINFFKNNIYTLDEIYTEKELKQERYNVINPNLDIKTFISILSDLNKPKQNNYIDFIISSSTDIDLIKNVVREEGNNKTNIQLSKFLDEKEIMKLVEENILNPFHISFYKSQYSFLKHKNFYIPNVINNSKIIEIMSEEEDFEKKLSFIGIITNIHYENIFKELSADEKEIASDLIDEIRYRYVINGKKENIDLRMHCDVLLQVYFNREPVFERNKNSTINLSSSILLQDMIKYIIEDEKNIKNVFNDIKFPLLKSDEDENFNLMFEKQNNKDKIDISLKEEFIDYYTLIKLIDKYGIKTVSEKDIQIEKYPNIFMEFSKNKDCLLFENMNDTRKNDLINLYNILNKEFYSKEDIEKIISVNPIYLTLDICEMKINKENIELDIFDDEIKTILENKYFKLLDSMEFDF